MPRIFPPIRSLKKLGLPEGYYHDGEYVIKEKYNHKQRYLTIGEKRLLYGLGGAIEDRDEAVKELHFALQRYEEFLQKTIGEIL